MTLLGFTNRYIFQWFFVRLTKHMENFVENYELRGYDLMSDGSISTRGVGKTISKYWYSIQYFVVPLTGWNSNYRYLNKGPKYFKITKVKKVK